MTVHLIIKGLVQGVFYRATAKEIADKLGLKGWVKNTDEGNVEALVNGNENNLKEFIEWCKKGPRNAKVSEVVWNEIEEVACKDFIILR